MHLEIKKLSEGKEHKQNRNLLGILAFGVKPCCHSSCIRYLKETEDLGFIALSRIFHISSQLLIRGGQQLEYPEKKHLTYRCRTWHVTCLLSKAGTTAVRDPLFKNQGS